MIYLSGQTLDLSVFSVIRELYVYESCMYVLMNRCIWIVCTHRNLCYQYLRGTPRDTISSRIGKLIDTRTANAPSQLPWPNIMKYNEIFVELIVTHQDDRFARNTRPCIRAHPRWGTTRGEAVTFSRFDNWRVLAPDPNVKNIMWCYVYIFGWLLRNLEGRDLGNTVFVTRSRVFSVIDRCFCFFFFFFVKESHGNFAEL